MDRRKVIFYENELTDEFSTAVIEPREIDENYTYCYKGAFKKFTHFFWYRIIATPIAYFYSKIKFGHKVVGRRAFRDFKNIGYFMYGNHTQDIGDAFMPHIMNFPKTNYTVVHPNNVSMPILGKITPSLGALPLPDNLAAYRNFLSAVERRIAEGSAVIIYPEAHIWPYYVGIRPFTDTSFSYPAKLNSAVFCFTNTYQKRKFRKSPKIVTYIDGPFYPDMMLSPKERKTDLRNRVYKTMLQRAENSNVEKIKYIKTEAKNG